MNITKKSKKLLAICLMCIMALGASFTSSAAVEKQPAPKATITRYTANVVRTTTQQAPDSFTVKAGAGRIIQVRLLGYPSYLTYNIGVRVKGTVTNVYSLESSYNTVHTLSNLVAGREYTFRFSSYNIPVNSLFQAEVVVY